MADNQRSAKGSKKDQIPGLILFIRYLALAVMTIVLTAMVVALF